MSRPLQNEVRWNDYVTTPLRRYQSRICNVAVGKNTIVVLPTGSGKTLIAATLTSWYKKERRGKTLFLVPTQMLVSQQASAIQNNNKDLKVMKFHSELAWPTNDYDVLVSTPEAYNRKLAAGDPLAQFPRFSLVVFDEVHHVSKKHPYRKLARALELSPLPRPVVLGLTATCTYAVSESQIGSDITKLCEALAITEVQTASQEELVKDGYHGATPSVQLHLPTTPQPSPPNDDIIDIFDSSVSGESQFMPHQSREAFFHSLANKTADPIVLRLYAVIQAVENMITRSYLPSFQSPLNTKGKNGKVSEWSYYALKIKVPASQALAHLYEALRIMVVTNSVGIDLVLEYIRMSIDKSQLASIGESGPVLQQIISDGGDITGASTPYMSRFLRLVNVIITQLDHHRSDQFRGILFVQQRITTHILKNFLDRVPSLSARLRVACIYATAGEATPFHKVTQSQSKERVGEFAAGRVNLLVATAVAEEGMDVPAANCIIRFDPVHTPVSFVQGRGRARQEESSFVVMDQRADRTVDHLTAAEQAQRSLLERGEVINADQMAAATAKRAAAQRSRELNAKEYLRNAKGNPTVVVKTFCTKSDREITEIFKQTNSGWTAIVSVLGVNGQKWMEEVTMSNKQE